MSSLLLAAGVTLQNHDGKYVSVDDLVVKTQEHAYSICDSQGTVLEINSPYEAMYGFSRDELVGKPFTVVVPEAQRETLLQLFKKFFEGFREIPQQYTVMRRDGSLATVRISPFLVNHPEKGALKLTLIEGIDVA